MLLTNEQISLVENWIKALRSGEYKQGKGTLWNRFTNTFCCLGVECKVNGVPDKDIAGSFGPWYNRNELLGFIGYRPSKLQSERELFASMNDEENYTFNDIASVLEFYLEVVRIEDEIEKEMAA